MPSRSRWAPRGRYALLDKKFGAPTITNDGVTIARDIELEDPYENMGAQLLEEVATKTNDVAGDGTTTSIVLGQAIITEGLKNVTAGSNPMGLKRGIQKAVDAIVEEIKRQSKPVETKEDIAHIAAISARDPEIGELIAEVMEQGRQGRRRHRRGVAGPEARRSSTSRGCSSIAATSAPTSRPRPRAASSRRSSTSPYILVTDKKISAVADILPALEKVVSHGQARS